MFNPLLKDYYEEKKKYIPVFNSFKTNAIQISPTTLRKYINLYLSYFGTKYIEKYTDLCLFLRDYGYNYCTCDIKDMLEARMVELGSEPFGTIMLLDEKQFISNIDKMKGLEFQNFIIWMFEKIGYNVIKNKQSHDQGADLIIEQNYIKTAVQTKRCRQKIPNKAIQAVFSGREYYKCNDSLVIANQYYTKDAKKLAKALNVNLWNREDLIDFFQRNKLQIINNL